MSAPIVVYFTDYTLAEDLDIEREVLAEVGAQIIRDTCRTEQDVLARVGDPDAIVTQWAPVTRAVIERLTRCKAISRNGIGVDNIDLAAARDHGIAVLNVPAYCIPEVADHAMALTLALLRKLQTSNRTMAEGRWDHSPQVPIWRISDQVFGIVGLGRIGSAVARRALPFFREVIACDPYVDPQRFTDLGVRRVDLPELLATADAITFHVPLTEGTFHLLDAAGIARLKPTAYIVNTSRGPVIDGAAIAAALQEGRIAGAGFDVWEHEPSPMDNPLRTMENVVLSPHSAFYSEQSVEQVRRQTCENIVRLFADREPINRVV